MDVQLTLSTCEECVDEMGRVVPPGNYYFKVTRMHPRMVSGTLFQRGEFGRFTFSYEQILQMVSIAQARLARRANISSPHMPSHASPQRPNTTPPISPLRQRPRPPPASLTCSICYEAIPAVELKTLGCHHPFHTACINTWLRRKRNCPLCRRAVPRQTTRLPRITQPPMRFRQEPASSVATTRRPQNPDDRVVTPPLRVRNMGLQAYRQRYGGYVH
jgi:hypothetical protein